MEAAKGHAFPRGQEMAPPVRHEFLTLFEGEDSLSEVPQQVSSNEESPIEITS